VAEGVPAKAAGAADAVIGADGTLAYIAGPASAQRRLVWIDGDGARTALPTTPHTYAIPRISPDGTRIALDIREQGANIWIWNIARETLTRLTDTASNEVAPLWSRDSQRIIFVSGRDSRPSLLMRPADGSAPAQELFRVSTRSTSLTPNGSSLLYDHQNQTAGGSSFDVMMIPLQGTIAPSSVLATQANETNAEISPDGRFLAYESDESGTQEVWVRPFPDVQRGRWQVSVKGGTKPAWGPKGRELYYVSLDDHLFRVDVALQPVFRAGAPKLVTDTAIYANVGARNYDVSPDGRLLVIEPVGNAQSGRATITVVFGQGDELKTLLPPRY
jgi:serine/threonine-protein kinase